MRATNYLNEESLHDILEAEEFFWSLVCLAERTDPFAQDFVAHSRDNPVVPMYNKVIKMIVDMN